MQIAKCQHHVDVVDAIFEIVDDVHARMFRTALMSCRFQEFDVFKSWFGKYAFLDPAGLVKSILVMTSTSAVARLIGLDNPQSAIVFGGLMGTTSGVTAGLAATDPKLVPYGAMTATFYTGVGYLIVPSVLFLVVRAMLE